MFVDTDSLAFKRRMVELLTSPLTCKLNSSVSVVKLNNHILEFFKTNTRQQVRIKVQNDSILKLVISLDGQKDIDQIAKEQNINPSELRILLDFLQSKGILDNVEPKSDFFCYEKYRRVIHFLSEYSVSHDHLLEMWKNIIKQNLISLFGIGQQFCVRNDFNVLVSELIKSRISEVIFNPFHFISQRNHLLTALVYNIVPGAKQEVFENFF